MRCTITDLCNKEVINVKDGCRVGMVCDVTVDTCTAQIISLIVYGKLKCFGLFGREDDIIIPWCDIEVIGEDTILVRWRAPECCGKRPGFWDGLFGRKRR